MPAWPRQERLWLARKGGNCVGSGSETALFESHLLTESSDLVLTSFPFNSVAHLTLGSTLFSAAPPPLLQFTANTFGVHQRPRRTFTILSGSKRGTHVLVHTRMFAHAHMHAYTSTHVRAHLCMTHERDRLSDLPLELTTLPRTFLPAGCFLWTSGCHPMPGCARYPPPSAFQAALLLSAGGIVVVPTLWLRGLDSSLSRSSTHPFIH